MASLGIFATVISGAAAFITYFHRGEHHLYGANYLALLLLICASSIAYFTRSRGYTLDEALHTTIQSATCFLIGLYTTCVLYRISPIHPLHNIPGPFGARISSLWLFFQVSERKQAHLTLLNAHQRYGKIVRVGSNDLSIVHPWAVERIHRKCRKAPFYDLNKPVTSIQTTRDKVLHDQLRRLWSTAFTETRLRSYEIGIKTILKHLLSRIDHDVKNGRPNQAIDATRLMNHYAFDIMGEVGYGTHFGMLTTGKEHEAIEMLNETMSSMGFMSPIWLIRLAISIPGLTKKWSQFVTYCFELMEICRHSELSSPIIASSLLGPYINREPTSAEKRILRGEAHFLIVAGSDTTSAALTCALYELVRNPRITDQLREAISASLRPGDTEISVHHVQNLDILNGIINETLRLYPPVPTTLWRLTPAEGLWIDEDTYIPGNVTVSTPQYVLGRDDDIYERPNDFIPERWYSKPEMVKHEGAFAPFNIGSYGCVGRPLAMLVLRITLAQLIYTYKITLPDSVTMDKVQTAMEGNMKDNFSLMPGQLKLMFKRRE